MGYNYNLKIKHDVADKVYAGDDLEALNGITSSDCAVAIYHRQLDDNLLNWLDSLPDEKLPETRITSLKLDDIWKAVLAVCQSHGIANENECVALVDDIIIQAKNFARLMKMDRVNLRLDVVDDDACRKFHQDNVAARLICTYRGRGTEYLVRSNGDKEEEINEVPKGSSAIFKGRRWHHAIPSAIYHRSPQIEGTGETRLLLVVDPYTQCDDDCC